LVALLVQFSDLVFMGLWPYDSIRLSRLSFSCATSATAISVSVLGQTPPPLLDPQIIQAVALCAAVSFLSASSA
jgi:hypothetical protein